MEFNNATGREWTMLTASMQSSKLSVMRPPKLQLNEKLKQNILMSDVCTCETKPKQNSWHNSGTTCLLANV